MVAQIQGMLRRHLLTHLSIGIGGGVAFGYLYWYGVHIPSVKLRDDYYVKAAKIKENEA